MSNRIDPGAATESPGPSLRIRLLVAEDNPAHAEAIRRAVLASDISIEVDVVQTLQQFHALVSTQPPDVALLDLNLPDGRATEALALTDKGPRFPMLIMTSSGDEDTAVKALKAGAFDYVVKSAEAFASLPRVIDSALREWRLREEHRQYEAELAAIYANAPFTLMLLDDDRRVRKANDLAATLAGIPAEEMIGLAIGDVFRCVNASLSPQGCAAATACGECALRIAVQETFDAGKPSRQLETEMTIHSGESTRKANFLFSTTLFVAGTKRRVLVSVVDITERKTLEANLLQTQKMESVGRLAGGVAHDFNNLLTVINGYSQVLLETNGPGSPNHAHLEEIRKAGLRAAGLTHQLLAYSRKQLMRPHVLELDPMIREMRPMLARLLGEDVDLILDLQAERAMVLADAHQLEQVVMNLAINARDAMPRGGTLTIETRSVKADPLLRPQGSATTKNAPFVKVSVQDTGVGMDEETQRHIFEPFYTTKEVGKGTGLGLSMAHGIVAQSGGYMEVYSERNLGATFSFYLPQVPLPEMEALSTATPAVGGPETILVVEDQAEVRAFVTMALAKYGYRVLEAGGGAEALEIFAREGTRIHLLLTDVVMPRMSGRELAREVTHRWPEIKILYMSGYTNDAIANHGLLDANAELIEKPFGHEQLARKLRSMLQH